MDLFAKVIGGVLISVVLYLALSKQSKELSVLLSLAVCCMVAAAAISYLEPVITFFEKLQTIAQLDTSLMLIILRAVGIGILSEIAALICIDAGNAALGKTLQIFACGAVLWMSVPLFTNLIDLVEEILISI